MAGTDSSGNNIYPARCGGTLNFPRYALSDGTRLFIADGGNDCAGLQHDSLRERGRGGCRFGEPDMFADIVSDPTATFATTIVPNVASTNTVRTPTSLAWDGTSLYVAEPYELRVLMFTPGDNPSLTGNSILNAASKAVYQEGTVALGGTINASDTVTITINDTTGSAGSKTYTYTVQKADTLETVATGLTDTINANGGDPTVIALVGNPRTTVYLSTRLSD